MAHKGGSFLHGQFHVISREPRGFPFQRWIDETPNEGLIYYRSLFNEERIFVTSPKTLAEVLVHKNYDFVKVKRTFAGLRLVVGEGVLFAEGDEHKVHLHKNQNPKIPMTNVSKNRYRERI